MDGLNWSSLVEPHTCNAAADGRVRWKLMKMACDGSMEYCLSSIYFFEFWCRTLIRESEFFSDQV